MRAKEFAESLEGIVSSFWFLRKAENNTKSDKPFRLKIRKPAIVLKMI